MIGETGKTIAGSAVRLAIFVIAALALLSGAYQLTRDRIIEKQRQAELRSLQEIVPPRLYDNDLLDDVIQVTDKPALGRATARRIYRARRGSEPIAVIMPVTAPDGYNGEIELLVGILYDGSVSGVRAISHRETPGLGDQIDTRVSDWIDEFTGRSLGNPEAELWAVRRDGGQFDQFTGATITPRAVVGAVRRALEYFQQHREELFATRETAAG